MSLFIKKTKNIVKTFLGTFVLFFLLSTGVSVAQTNLNTTVYTYQDISPGVTGQLTVVTETINENEGAVRISGSLKYDFPPQPNTFNIIIKNLSTKSAFANFSVTAETTTPQTIDLSVVVPLDKNTKTKTSQTSDQFQILSSVDKGVDFFFANSKTLLTFKPFTQPTQQNNQNQTDPIIVTSNPSTGSIVVLNAGTPDTKTNKIMVKLGALTYIPPTYKQPVYIGLDRSESGKDIDFNISAFKNTSGTTLPNGMLYGISEHSMEFENGKFYRIDVWASNNSVFKKGQGDFLGTFTIDSSYLFSKKAPNIAPGLANIDQSKIDNLWDSLTGTFNPGEIEFVRIGSGGSFGPTTSDDAYIFLTRIPGLENSTKLGSDGNLYPAFDPTKDGSFSRYISIFINMIYGFIALIAVFNIMYYGLNLMIGSATPFKRKNDKSRIWDSFIALALALGSYLILNTINPNLTNWNISPNKISLEGEGITFLSEGQVARLSAKNTATDKKFVTTTYYSKIKNLANDSEYKMPHCLVQVNIMRESGGISSLIGHDENAPSSSVRSRRNFLSSGRFFKGGSFNSAEKKATDRDLLNDDNGSGPYTASNPSASDLGLDWRFSHGIGLLQVTFFPKDSRYGDYISGIYMPIMKRTVKPKDMLDPDTAILAGMDMMKRNYDSCGQDPLRAFKKYASGSCDSNNSWAVQEAGIRKSLFDQCVAQDK